MNSKTPVDRNWRFWLNYTQFVEEVKMINYIVSFLVVALALLAIRYSVLNFLNGSQTKRSLWRLIFTVVVLVSLAVYSLMSLKVNIDLSNRLEQFITESQDDDAVSHKLAAFCFCKG